ncbi:hypothetical protein ACEWY4_007237 [Coilia grayii]|uniref:NAD(P)(+)--arginine ADP-ribosyltransferase n=1 Tax=Coilia grayii TaxID=363190 RepID=A0ABD1KG02_9TELE
MAGWRVWYTSVMFFTMVTHEVSYGEAIVMDMAPNAVDDSYSTCRDKMLTKILAKDGILQEELKANSEFKSAWNSTSHCSPVFPGGQPQHVQAFQAFGNDEVFSKTFNEAVKTKGGDVSIYTDQFKFKSLHFLLMDAMRILNNGSQCKTVYSGIFDDFVVEKGHRVRFGEFFSVSASKSYAEEGCVDEGTLFRIDTCSVVDLTKHACHPEHTTMLLSPVEVFNVVDVTTGKSDCAKEIALASSGFISDHNCYLFPMMPTTSAPATATARSTSSTTAQSAKGSSTQGVDPRGLVLLTIVFHFFLILSL